MTWKFQVGTHKLKLISCDSPCLALSDLKSHLTLESSLRNEPSNVPSHSWIISDNLMKMTKITIALIKSNPLSLSLMKTNRVN